MGYNGKILDACGLVEMDLTEISVVAMSGSGPNVCGHLILFMPRGGGYYFHVAEIIGYPYYMNGAGFERYKKENKKTELRRLHMTLPDPRAAEAYLEAVMSRQWAWGALPHNCVAFCEAVIRAGGSEWGSYTNCPALATDVPQQTISRFLNQMEWEIRRAYGVVY